MSSAASAANGIVDGLRALATETPAGQAYSMATCSQGQYGVDEGLIFSFPCRTENGVVKVVEGVALNDAARGYVDVNIEALREERDAVKELLG